MTTLREAAQQALEALRCVDLQSLVPDYGSGHYSVARLDGPQVKSAITALKAALAEPVQYTGVKLKPVFYAPRRLDDEEVAAIIAAPPQPPAEPMYWEVRCTAHPKWMRVDEQQFDEYVAHGWEGQKLYTAPPQRKPLSKEEIKECERQAMVNGSLPFEQRVFFARAIERAHGIT